MKEKQHDLFDQHVSHTSVELSHSTLIFKGAFMCTCVCASACVLICMYMCVFMLMNVYACVCYMHI